MSPKLRMWLLTLAFISALLTFTLLISGLEMDDSRREAKVIFTQPDEIIAGTPVTLTFTAVDDGGEALGGDLINLQITQPEYEALVLKGDLYTIDEVATVTFNFQDTGSYVIETSIKDEDGAPISQVEKFVVHPEPPVVPRTAQLKGWLLLMGALVFGILAGNWSMRTKNLIE